MTWRVFLTDSSQPDLDRLTPADRAALTDELLAWVSDGPPRTSGKVVAGVQLFEDLLPSGISRPSWAHIPPAGDGRACAATTSLHPAHHVAVLLIGTCANAGYT